MSTNDAYDVLGERLGWPGSAGMRRVLQELMSAEQAQMAVALPGTPQEVAETTGIEPQQVKEALDDLFFKGVVFVKGDFHNREFYRFARTYAQLHDATMASAKLDLEKDRRLFELWWDFKENEWFPTLSGGLQESAKSSEEPTEPPRPGLRIIPAYGAIKDLPGVLPCENYEELLEAQERIAVTPCPCRLNVAAVGDPCDIHSETDYWACLSFGRAADYVVARGSGKALSLEEALELNNAMEASGLLHWWMNEDSLTATKFGCNCCRDCCAALAPLDLAGLSIGRNWAKSRYVPHVIQDDCTGCQVCVDRCAFDAIEMVQPEGSKKYKAVVIPDECFGCGVCVIGCDAEALKMKAVRPPDHIPAGVPHRGDPAHG